MRRILSAACALPAATLALALAGPAAAQAPPPSSSTARPAPGEKAVTVSGCVEGGPSGYTLSTLVGARAPHEEGEAHVGTAGASLSYTLTARDGVDLAEFVGKKVEVRGVLQAPATPARPSKAAESGAPDVKQDDSPDARTTGTRAAAPVVAPKVAVTSVQLLSATCQ